MGALGIRDLAEARARGRIDADTWRSASRVLASSPPAAVWAGFLQAAGLVLGTALVLAGVVYLVAWNWAMLGYLTKLCLGAGLVAAAGAAGVFLGAERLSGRLAMASAGVLVGPLLVVHSQAYQTGANPWVLFAAWAALMVPFALAARLSGLWLLWVALVDVTLLTRAGQASWGDLAGICATLLGIGVLHAGIVAGWERFGRGRTLPRVLCAAGFLAALLPALAALVEPDDVGPAGPMAAVCVLAAVGTVHVAYARSGRDLFMVAAAGGAVIMLLTSALARFLVETGDRWVLWTLLLGSALVVQSLLLVVWVRAAQARARAREGAP